MCFKSNHHNEGGASNFKGPGGGAFNYQLSWRGTVLKFWCPFRKIPGPPDVNSGHSNDVTDEIIV